MSILGPTYRFVVENRTGQTISAANGIMVEYKGWKFASDGSIVFNSSFTPAIVLSSLPVSNSTSLTNLSYLFSDIIDNLAVKLIGLTIEFTVTVPASSNGNVILYLERSVDGGSTWPDAGLGQPIGFLNFTTSGTKRTTINL
jgi:hypothetical protein